MTEEYMDEHADELDRDEESLYQKMSVDFIRKYIKHINFHNLSVNPFITFEILDAFSNKISWASISINGKMLSESLMFNYRNKLIWKLVLAHQQLQLKFLIIMSEVMRKSRAKAAKDFWDAVSRYQKVDVTYVSAYKRYINFAELGKNPYIDDAIIDKFIDKLDIPTLIVHQKLSKNILTKYSDQFRDAFKTNEALNK
jgi:hypothetical protein